MPEAGFHHRASLKQQNKPFKSKHATKGALKDKAKGRVSRQPIKNAPNSSAHEAQKRVNRRNMAKQIQLNKRHALMDATRVFSGVDGAPRIVAVIPLTEDVSAKDSVGQIAKSLNVDADSIPEAGLWRMKVDRFKTSLQFILVPYGSFFPSLDALKVADYSLLLLSSRVEVDGWGDTLLRTMQAQGFPSTISVISPSNLATQPHSTKEQSAILKSLLSFMRYFIPSHSRVYDLEASSNSSDAINVVRALCEGKPADVRWREDRPYMLVEETEWTADGDLSEGTLRVTGVIRGAPLSANRLVHLSGFGDFKISKIIAAPFWSGSAVRKSDDMQIERTVLSERIESSADTLVSTNNPDDMNNEQTWPTEEEMRGVGPPQVNGDLPEAKPGTTPRVIKKVPKGTSAYQAAWFVDDEEHSDNDEEEPDDHMSGVDGETENPETTGGVPEDDEEMEEIDTVTEGGKKTVGFQDLNEAEEKEQLDSWRNRAREEAEDSSFPDEIDTPQDVAARIRFQRYRGLHSFRTSPWDPYENLPREYARIFQFEDYKRTERGIVRKCFDEEGAVQAGMRVSIEILGVGTSDKPFAVFGLFQHEHKVSVQHYKVQRDTEYSEPVKSKDPLTLCVGPRRLRVNPIFSQHTRGGGKGVNNVHKYERFLRHGSASVATIYGPVCFGRQSCALLQESQAERSAPRLVATGSFLSPDTTRIIAKRIALTGHPFKVHKRTATIRYMFFNPDDVSYFAPVQLKTKYGRTGHIRESLGTHGYFKAHFDGPISQMDTVCMSLYKRVYPKWALPWKQISAEMSDRSVDPMEE